MNLFTYQIGPFGDNSPTLGQKLDDSVNLFTPLRMILALGVLLGHSYVVHLGRTVPEPLHLFNLTLSYISVNGFFILSGLLITRSIDRNSDLIRFFTARFLRLYPAMVVMTLLAAFVIGPMVSALPMAAYFADPMVWRYVCDVLTFGNTSGGPPQIFAQNPFDGEWSASLWTLRYEAMAYAGTALLAVLGLNRSKTAMLAVFVAVTGFFVAVRLFPQILPDPLVHLSRFGMTYLLGALLYVYRDQIKLSWVIGAVTVILAATFGWFGSQASFEILLNFVLAAGLLLIGFAKLPFAAKLSRMPDFSYGVYIWQWPIMQALWYFEIARSPLVTMALAIPASIAVGALSWYLLEKPALALKTPLAGAIRNAFKARKTA
ncbi:MAG: hypothetical protein COA47_04615 [Robiginitomaculum sp.]|nr:MAG: hypothetical protein COA47_04615 [Robiginitomaculum sp.]